MLLPKHPQSLHDMSTKHIWLFRGLHPERDFNYNAMISCLHCNPVFSSSKHADALRTATNPSINYSKGCRASELLPYSILHKGHHNAFKQGVFQRVKS